MVSIWTLLTITKSIRYARFLRKKFELARKHRLMRQELGIAGEDSAHIRDLFHQKYRGSRYSFGYPACPNLEDQTKLFALLHPEENVRVRLTSGFLLEPEQSTSAIVVHHPRAKYFVV
jgi:5-methyltetrahydrofolate--homocysteine methyltransferase